MTPYDLLLAPFVEFPFMRRALVGTLVLAIGAAPVGVFLMLRRMSLTGDAMAHAILPGAAVGFLIFGLELLPMTLGGIVAGLAVVLLSGLVARLTPLREDASLAAFYLLSLATGVLIVSMRGSSVDLMHVLFGTVLALDDLALMFIATTTTITLVVLAIILRPLILECADPRFLGIVSGSGGIVHMAFMTLVVLNLVAGFQALGTLLAVGLMMLPAAAARLWSRDLMTMTIVAVAIASCAGYAGLLASYHLSAPSGPAIILAAGLCYIASLFFGAVGGVARGLFTRSHRTA